MILTHPKQNNHNGNGRLLKLVKGVSGFAFVRSLSPLVATQFLNNALQRFPGYRAHVGDLSMSVLKGRLRVSGISLVSTDQNAPLVAASIANATLQVRPRPLLKGVIECAIDIEQPVVMLRKPAGQADTKKSTKKPTPPTSTLSSYKAMIRKIKALSPVKLDHINIINGAVHVKNLPAQDGTDVRLDQIYVSLRNISNRRPPTGSAMAKLYADARAMSSGRIRISGEADVLRDEPIFRSELELKDLDLREFAPLIRAYTARDVRDGRLDVAGEVAAAEGQVRGYLKPALLQVKMEKPGDQPAKEALKGTLVRSLVRLFKNRRKDQIAAKIEFGGDLTHPQLNVMATVKTMLGNAFFTAISPALERSVKYPFGRTATTRRPSRVKRAFVMLKKTVTRWIADDAPRMGASLSFYTAFSMAPLLLISISMAGFIFGRAAAQGKIFDELQSTLGASSAAAIQSMLRAAQEPAAGALATIIGFVTLLVGASGVMGELKFALNKIWRAKAPSGFKAVVRNKLLSFGMVLAIGFLLLVSLLLSAALAAVSRYMGDVLPIPAPVMHLSDAAVSFGIITALFAALYRVLPDTTVEWSNVWIGGAITSFLFVVGKFLLGLYLGKETAGSYGAAGSVLVTLLWVYYSAQILYFGAELTKVYTEASAPAEQT